MKLEMDSAPAQGYRSASQAARRVTEAWALTNMYCVRCESQNIAQTPNNTKACDFSCKRCMSRYELKASRRWNERSVPDAGYSAMMKSINAGTASNLLVMQYLPGWIVGELMMIPAFALTESVIERRKPLSPTARRAGWVGCNITVGDIPEIAKVRIIHRRRARPVEAVREEYARVRSLENQRPNVRGWTLDVLRTCESLPTASFRLADVYAAEDALSRRHPDNNNVKAKIRQQLQVLRDAGIIQFHGRGRYTLLSHQQR